MTQTVPPIPNAASQKAIKLNSSRLTIEIAAPGSIYQGTRFDWSGFITQVTLDGKHTFCVPESYKPGDGTGGIGLCNEFGNQKAIGYADAQPGELFPKPGIGLLVRPDSGDYNFFRSYVIAKPFPIQVEASPQQATYMVEPVECRGYAMHLTKVLSVEENWLKITYRLVNTGEKPIDTHEYYHNFLGIDKHLIGPDYRLHLPYPIRVEKLPPQMLRRAVPRILRFLPGAILDKLVDNMLKKRMSNLVMQGGDLTFKSTPKTAFFFRPLGFNQSEEAQWELVHLPSGVGLREYDDFAPEQVAVWGTRHVISAEVYASIHIEPGEGLSWTRRYEFFVNSMKE